MDEARCRSGRHAIKSSQDRRPNGGCAACARENEDRYRRKLRAKADLMDRLQRLLDEPTIADRMTALSTSYHG